MHLNLQTDYALRVLMILAATGKQMSVDEIARSYGISRNHLAKVAHRLQALGYISATRGRSGGLNLAVAPESVNVGTVVRTLESLDSFVECMGDGTPSCPAVGVCGLQGALHLALEDFLKRLDGYTLSDLVPDPDWFVLKVAAAAPHQPAA